MILENNMKRMKYPSTELMLRFLYDDYGYRCSCLARMNMTIAKTTSPDEFFGWMDDGWLWDMACEFKDGIEKSDKWVYIGVDEMKELMMKYESENLAVFTDDYYCDNGYRIVSVCLKDRCSLKERLREVGILLPICIRTYLYMLMRCIRNRFSYKRTKILCVIRVWKYRRKQGKNKNKNDNE